MRARGIVHITKSSRRGSVLVVVLLMIVMIGVVVASVISTGENESLRTVTQVQGERAALAAESAANMAVKELMADKDYDGDGTIGSVSSDSNSANDPIINAGTRVRTTKGSSGGQIVLTAMADNDDAARTVQVTLTPGAPPANAGTILLVVVDSTALQAQETLRKSQFQAWGYAVSLISESATQAQFDAAVRSSSVAYVCESVLSANVGTKLTNAPIGIVCEESDLSDELGMSSSMTAFSGSTVNMIDTTHYITKVFSAGTLTMFSANQPVRYMSGTLGGVTTLGRQVATTNPTFAIMERGATLTPSGTAAGRRVYLPFGNTGVDFAQLTTDGKTLVQRSIEWCLLPVAHYKLDETSGTTAVDAIAGRNGVLYGPTWGTGKFNSAPFFNGTSDYLRITNHSSFQVTKALTVAGWIKASTWPADGNWASIILRKGDANPCNWELEVSAGKATLVLDDYDVYGIRGSTTLPLNTWTHVAATWDGTTVRIYVNGVLDNTPVARAAPITTDTRDMYIGGRIGGTDVVAGSVDDVRFYSRALTAAEVVSIMQTTQPTVTKWTSIAP